MSWLQNTRSGWISRIPSRLRSYRIRGKTSASYVIMRFRLSSSSLVPSCPFVLAPRCCFTCVPLGFFLLTFTVSMYSRVCWDSGEGYLRFRLGYGRDIGIEQLKQVVGRKSRFRVFPEQTQKYGFSPVRDLVPAYRQQGGRCPSERIHRDVQSSLRVPCRPGFDGLGHTGSGFGIGTSCRRGSQMPQGSWLRSRTRCEV